MRALKFSRTSGAAILLALALVGAACQPGATTNANLSTANANANANANTAATPTLADVVSIETREPEQYRGTLVFTATAEGQSKALQLPVEVARNGDNRRYAFNNIPVIGQVIFLDRADKRYLILPTRKQYAEITPELLGFDVRSLTPGQMVVYLQKQRGVERVGEEQREGRTVVKYRHAATAKTTSAAGDVATESFIYVDKETGLPLHADLTGQSTGNVQGVKRASLVADMRDIQTTADASLFELPTGLTKLTEEEIKQRVSEIAGFFQVAMGMLNTQLRGNSPDGAPTTGATPATGSTPAASPAQ
jgi:archaellum component FlaF (FlaF/FlaG flagellin family)